MNLKGGWLKILFTNITEHHKKNYAKLGKQLLSRNYDVLMVTSNKEFEEFINSRGVPCINIKTKVNERSAKINNKQLKKEIFLIEKKYKTKLKNIYISPQLKTGKKEVELQKETVSYIREWELLLKQYKPDLIINISEMILNTSCEIVAKYMRILMIHTHGCSVFDGRLTWATTYLMNDWINKKYLKRKPTKKEKKALNNYICSFKRKKRILGGGAKPVISKKRFFSGLRYLYKYYFEYEGFREYLNPFKMFINNFCRILKRIVFKIYYKPVNKNEKYIYFPLHVPDDAQITLRSPQFYREDKVVEKIAKNLPKDYVLYVKEHPHSIASLNFSWFRNILKQSNVRIINPTINSHDLIKNCKGVITIRSDVGWEALLYGKPVLVLTDAFYSGFGVIVDCFNFNRVKPCINKLLAKSPDKKKTYKLIYAAWKSSYEGTFYGKNALVDKNIENIANSILKKYKEIRRKIG